MTVKYNDLLTGKRCSFYPTVASAETLKYNDLCVKNLFGVNTESFVWKILFLNLYILLSITCSAWLSIIRCLLY